MYHSNMHKLIGQCCLIYQDLVSNTFPITSLMLQTVYDKQTQSYEVIPRKLHSLSSILPEDDRDFSFSSPWTVARAAAPLI